MRLLTRREFEASIADVFGVAGLGDKFLPPDRFDPYDTDTAIKTASLVFLEGLESLAYDLGKSASANAAFVGKHAPCASSAKPDDSGCLSIFTSNLGKMLLRRPMTNDEVQPIVQAGLTFAKEKSSFALGVRYAIQTLLQHPSFVYRIELGTPEGNGKNRLDNYEIITRLSYLILGTTPDEQYLAVAGGAQLTTDQVRDIAKSMLADPRAEQQILYFHQLWFGYKQLRVPPNLVDPMLAETDELLKRVLTGAGRPWTELFTSRESFVNQALADHYGMTGAGAQASWVQYTHPERAGILSHGSFLSLSSRNTDGTSPTIRGKFVATRLLCRTIPPPPPAVNVDDPPQGSADQCKAEAYKEHRQKGSPCFGCHQLMDPIGFGLERFDGLGRYRTVEKVNQTCQIDGAGDLGGGKTFSGVKQLVDLMLAGDELRNCAVKQLLHFTMGHEPTGQDQGQLDRLASSFKASGEDFKKLMLDLVTDPAFRLRVDK
ncbi:MAG: DUF1588 domain-containing protein [Myxococcales bacterium]|nr:DUF1588 domain-containing protein [Myxococcales bacterium]